MTYGLGKAAGLLQPQQVAHAMQIARDPGIVPDLAGIYGWWFDGDLPSVPLNGSLEYQGRRLLYVGIAPSAPSQLGRTSRRTLRDRLKNHTRGPVAQSTLRRTLAVLLRRQLDLRLKRLESNKLFLLKPEEERLTGWMNEHAVVAWMTHTTPWIIEHELITKGPRLPLNIKGSLDPFRLELIRMRQAAGF